MNKPILLILAAGIGSRFGGLKQISEVGFNGETIMDYSIEDALEIGFEKIVIVIQEKMLDQLRDKYLVQKKLPVFFSIQRNEIRHNNVTLSREKPWGTAHAVLAAKENLDQPFFIINADDYYGWNSLKLGFDFLQKNNQNCAIVFPIEQTLSLFGSVNRAEVLIENGMLTETTERMNIVSNENGIYYNNDTNKSLSKSTIVSMNLWGLSPDFLTYLETDFYDFIEIIENNPDSTLEYQLPTAINKAIKSNRIMVKTFITNEEWIGLTYKEDLIIAKHKFNDRYKKLSKTLKPKI